jgi:hypothetical protein
MTKRSRRPAASEIVAQALQQAGMDISVDEVEAIYNNSFYRSMAEELLRDPAFRAMLEKPSGKLS